MTNIVTIQNVRGYVDREEVAWLNAEDVARGLGWTQIKNGVEYIRWETINAYLAEFNFPKKVGKNDFIPENMFYRLVWKSRDEKALNFQAMVADEILPVIRKTGSYSIKTNYNPYTPAANAVKDVQILTNQIQELFAVQRGIAISQAIDIASEMHNAPLQSLKQLLPPAEHNTGLMNPTQIGEKLGGIKSQIVNQMLKDLDFQYKEGKSWRTTHKGSAYGEELPYTRNGHSGYQIRWNENVLNVLRGDKNG